MELLDLYTNSVDGVYDEYRKRVEEMDASAIDELNRQRKNRIWWGRHGKQMIQFLDGLKSVAGPRKWSRDDHGYLIVLPQRHIHLREQVKIEANGIGPYKVTYWLPESNFPWEHCSATASSPVEAAELVVDALGKCEQELIPRGGDMDQLEWILKDIENGQNGDGDPETPPWLR